MTGSPTTLRGAWAAALLALCAVGVALAAPPNDLAPRSGAPYNHGSPAAPADSAPGNAPATPPPEPSFPAGLPVGAGPRGPMRPYVPPDPAAASAAAPGASAGAGGGEDIRDIRGPKFVLPAWVLAAIGGGVVVAALAIYYLWRWRRSRRRARVLLPFEVALQRLEEIRALMQPARAREFSIAVSDIVRTYIEQRFDLTATHRTTEEFLHDLLETSNTSLAKHRALLAEFLQQCDLVKFAGMALTSQSMESLHDSARVFVLETAKPEPEPPAEVEARVPVEIAP